MQTKKRTGRAAATKRFKAPGGLYKVQKVSVALGEDVLAWARSRAEREGLSLSAVLTEVARVGREAEERHARQEAAWRAFVDWATEGAGLSAAEVEAAERELYGTPASGAPASPGADAGDPCSD